MPRASGNSANLPKQEIKKTEQQTHSDAKSPGQNPNSPADLAELTKENNAVRRLLTKRGYADDAITSKARLIASAIHFSEKNRHSRVALARHIQKIKGTYEGRANESMSEMAQKNVIRDWIAHNIFGKSIAGFIEEKVLDNKQSLYLNNRDILNFVSNKAYSSEMDLEEVKNWILHNVILEEIPILSYFFTYSNFKNRNEQPFELLEFKDFEWGQIHAGLQYAKSKNILIESISVEEALAMGKFLILLLKKNPEYRELWDFFKLPAMLRYAQDNPDVIKNKAGHLREDIEARALVDYVMAHEKFIDDNCPAAHFQKLLTPYKTLFQLEQEEIDNKCQGMKKHTLINMLDKYGTFCRTASEPIFLENITEKYGKQVNEIADAYATLDLLLVSAATGQIVDEIDFIRQAKIQRAQAEFQKMEFSLALDMTGAVYKSNTVSVMSPDVELFVATNANQEERIYVLQKNGQGYDFKRIDRNSLNYHAFLTADQKYLKDKNLKLRINISGNVLKSEADTLETFIDEISQKHKENFRQQLYDYGYEKTPLKKFTDFLTSLIPFYNCITAGQQGRIGEALLSCSLDVASFIPVLGNLSKLSLKFGQAAIIHSLKKAHIALGEAAARSALRATFAHNPMFLIKSGWQGGWKSIDKEALIDIAKSVIAAADPFMIPLMSFSQISLRQTIQAGEYIKNSIPGLRKILRKMKKLNPAHSDFSRHMKLIQTEGLGGVGASQKAANWGNLPKRNRPPPQEVNPVMLSQVQQLIKNDQIPLETIRTQYKLTPKLYEFINNKGELTEKGQALLRLSSAPAPATLDKAAERAAAQPPAIPSIVADEAVKAHFRTLSPTSTIVVSDDGTGEKYFHYRLDQNAFFDAYSNDIFIIDEKGSKKKITFPELTERQQHITNTQRTETIKALDIDLDIDEILARQLPPTTAIPKEISFIWVGDKLLNDKFLKNIKNNIEIANRKGYTTTFYLSEKSQEINYSKLLENISYLSPDKNKILILENTDIYKEFIETENFLQYRDAIDGNGGIATNYASAADIFRYFSKYKTGGIYSDIDDIFLEKFGQTELKTAKNGLIMNAPIATTDRAVLFFGTSMFGTHKNNPLFKEILKEINKRYQQEPYKNFYKIPRPLLTDRKANREYAKQLFDLTGPSVFNHVLINNLPEAKSILALHRLKQLGGTSAQSAIIDQLEKKLQLSGITGLNGANRIGSANSWRHYR